MIVNILRKSLITLTVVMVQVEGVCDMYGAPGDSIYWSVSAERRITYFYDTQNTNGDTYYNYFYFPAYLYYAEVFDEWGFPIYNSDQVQIMGIEDYAFSSSTLFRKIVCPGDCDYSIGNGAFSNCPYLEEIDVSYASIGDYAFADCISLEKINLVGVKSIGEGAFSGCTSLEQVDLSHLESIGDGAFSGCTSLVDVRIGDGVGAIEGDAFYGCTSLKDINLNNVVSIGSYAFYGCTSLEHLTINGMIEYYYNNYGYQSESVFHGCSVLSNLTITSGIGQDIGILFKDVPITKITLSNDFSFDYYRDEFSLFKSLTQLEVSDDNPYLMVREGMLFDKTGKILYFCLPGLKNVAIPDYVTSIGRFTFRGCSQLESISVGTENLNYKSVNGLLLSKDGKILIRGVNGDVTIPDGVTSISSYAFYGCRGLTSVAIPDSVMSIGASAFEDCSSLTSVTIPDSVTSIGSSAFYGCSSLTSVTIGAGVTDIGIFSDYNSSILEFKVSENNTRYSSKNGLLLSKDGKTILKGVNGIVTIPDGVTCIGPSAFEDCSSLTSVTIPDSVTSIGSSAFYGCSSLTSVTIPDSVTSIGEKAFYNCSRLTSVTIPDSVTSIGERAFFGCSGLTSVTIPDSVTSIGYEAFYGCRSLTSVTIPDGVTSIGRDAFGKCSSLTSVTIPDSVTSIGSSAFYGCCGLRSLTIPFVGSRRGNSGSADSLFGYIFGVLSYEGARSTKQYYSSGSYFSSSTYYIPTNLTTVIITDETQLGYGAFYGCDSLTSVAIGDSVTSIGISAFYGCSSLASVTIPDSVTSIGDDAFSGCNSKLYDRTTISGVSLVDGWAIDCETSLSGNLNLIGVRGVANSAFAYCSSLTSVTIPGSVTSIGDDAFSGCNSKLYDRTTISGVSLVDGWAIDCETSLSGNLNLIGVRGVANSAFAYCSSLTSVTIPDGVTSIGNSAFHYCSKLTSVTIPGSVTSIGNRAFYYCSGLTSVTIGNGVTSIGDYAFYYCRGLTSVTIPDSVTSIGDYAFDNCSSLWSVTIGDSVTSIGSFAFCNCSKLWSVTIGDSVTIIGFGAFEYCSSLRSVTIPDSVTSIESCAFEYCSSLRSVTFKGDVPSGISNSYILNYATKVYYPEKYAAAYEAIVPASKFGGYVSEDGTIGIVSQIKYEGLMGAAHTNPATYVEGSGIASFLAPSDINGYTFIGWAPTSISADATGVQTITAQWRKDELSVPVISAPLVFETPSCTVTISAETGAAIYYTLDGSMPTAASVLYTAPIVLTETATIKAIAVREDYFDSPVASCSVTRRIKTLGECVNSGTFSFTTGGDAEWVRAYGESADGFALRSGDITHSQTSRLDMVVSGSGVITFSCRVEGEIIRNIVFDGLAFCIDGVPQGTLIGDSSWTRKSFSVTGPGEHTLSWLYVKDYEGDGAGADCAWLDCVVWESVAEVIPEVKDDSEVEAVLKESADAKLVENIKDAAEYNAYREWAAKLPDVTPQQVKESPQAWLSYALDADTLIAEAPKTEDVKIDEFKVETSTPGEFNLSVSVENVTIGENAKTENLAKVFGIEGATSLEGNGFSSENVGIEFGKPVDGKVKLKATPKDKSVKSFFMRVKVK